VNGVKNPSLRLSGFPNRDSPAISLQMAQEYTFSPVFGAAGSVEVVVGTTRARPQRARRAEEEIKSLSELSHDILEGIRNAFSP